MPENTIFTQRHRFYFGEVVLGSIGDSLCLCLWPTAIHFDAVMRRLQRGFNADIVELPTAITQKAADMIDSHFMQRLPMVMPLKTFGTELQQDVWRAIAAIPPGYTESYSDLARRAGHPMAVRAVASAVGANALNLFIPCHRVLPADGSVGNYAGLPYTKYRLLRHEGVAVEYHRNIRV